VSNPPFAEGRDWYRRASHARSINRRVWYDPDDKFEYERDPVKDTWHQIDWRENLYRDLDPETGKPVSGSEGEWRRLR
jgi:hypothetical protein